MTTEKLKQEKTVKKQIDNNCFTHFIQCLTP
mgnify:CR=1 FL=1